MSAFDLLVEEQSLGANPCEADSDGDGYESGNDDFNGFDPNDAPEWSPSPRPTKNAWSATSQGIASERKFFRAPRMPPACPPSRLATLVPKVCCPANSLHVSWLNPVI